MTSLKHRVLLCAALLLGSGLATATCASAQEVVRIGYTGPLSGGAALYGKNCVSGMQMAADEINAKGGLEVGAKKYKLEIVTLDDRYLPSEAAINAKRLVQEYKTPVVFTPHSGGAFALQAFNQDMNFLLAAYTSVPQMTERGNKLTIRIPPSFAGYIEPFSAYEMKRFGKKVALAGGDHDYAKTWRETFVPVWQKLGGEVVAENPMSYNRDTDFYSGVSKVLAAKPDVMFIGGASEPTGLVVKQARELGFEGGFIVMDQAKLNEMGKAIGGLEPLEGAIGVLPLTSDDRPISVAFVKRYHETHSDDPGSEASLNYNALYIMAGAMQAAGSVTDPAAIRAKVGEAIKALAPENNPQNFTGVDEKGALSSDLYVAVVEKGKIKPLRMSEITQ
jgi:branched-chain amino acid transport system substrate-binding protein